MKEKSDPMDAGRMIAEGRRQAETRRIKKLCGEPEEPPFDLSKANHYWAVGNGLPLPSLSPVEVATIAASLLPRQQSERAACETALRLIREAAALIEAEKEKDRRTQGHLEDNEANRRMWRNLGKRIARSCKKGKPFRETFWKDRRENLEFFYPFPISVPELVRLAELKEDAGRKRINKALEDSILHVQELNRDEAKRTGNTVPDDLTADELAARVKELGNAMRSQGIYQPTFLIIAKAWPELGTVMAECREEN